MQADERPDVCAAAFGHGVHELLGLEVTVLDVVGAPAPLPLAIRDHVPHRVIAGALQQEAERARLRHREHHARRRDARHERSLPRVCREKNKEKKLEGVLPSKQVKTIVWIIITKSHTNLFGKEEPHKDRRYDNS